jgi:hypothetical protein
MDLPATLDVHSFHLEMTMNRKIALALVATLAAAGNAFADDITIDNNAFVSTRSRAEVQAELAQFKQSGVNPWANNYNQLRGFQSTKTRTQVAGEYVAARDQVAALTGEDSGSASLARARTGVAASTLASASQLAR